MRLRPRGGEVVVDDDVGNTEAASGAQHAVDLGEDGGFVGGQVDHAVGDHDDPSQMTVLKPGRVHRSR